MLTELDVVQGSLCISQDSEEVKRFWEVEKTDYKKRCNGKSYPEFDAKTFDKYVNEVLGKRCKNGICNYH